MKTTALVFFLAFSTYGYSNNNPQAVEHITNEKLRPEIDSLEPIVKRSNPTIQRQIMISLTFQKSDAEQAMNFYVDLFDNSKIIDIHRWGAEGPGKEGTIMQAVFELNGQRFMCSDSPPVHSWDFTPAVSIYIECEDKEEIERLFSTLSKNGEVAMPLNNYGFSRNFAWVIDQFGVSWQLNLQ